MLEVKRFRQDKGWNQTELAYHAGLAPSVISQIENGKRDPSARTLRKLADALGVEVGDLFPKEQARLPLDLEQRRETARRLMDAGVSEATARGVSGMDHRSEEYWRALARVSGLESSGEAVRPGSILADVLVASAKTLADTDAPKSIAEFGRIQGMVSLIDAVRTPLLEFVMEAMARGGQAVGEDVEEIAEVATQLTKVSTLLTERNTMGLKESNENLRQINEYLKRQIEEATNDYEQREAEEMREQMRQLTERISA